MWLPRLMRAANEEQEHRAAIGLSGQAAQNLFGTLVTCDCGHLSSCRRTTPLVCARTDVQLLKHRFTLVKWCCIAFLLLIFTLIGVLDRNFALIAVFSGLLTTASTELTSGSSYLFLAIIVTSLLLFGGLCCLRAHTICRFRDVYHSSLHCRRSPIQPSSLRLPVSLFTHAIHSRSHVNSSPSAFRFPDSSFYNALLEACTAPLPTYNEAVKEPVFAPPAYSTVITQPSRSQVISLNESSPHHVPSCTPSLTGNETVIESSISSNNRDPEQEMLVHSHSHAVETVTSVEVHHIDEVEDEIMSNTDEIPVN
ncbi:unnamed protein product [Thelazia callipaeda]|uniref:Transmembrane protein n=1 Tax=Thelazia callipaeda TaxID=103827 RepID=A0A0N5CZR6_THECL|nr:unnamed protein product [Thelazia callipaeda]